MTDDWRRFIQEVRHYWSLLHQKYKMTVPNKVHIIIDHVEDYIEATGQQKICEQQVLGKRPNIRDPWDKIIQSNFIFQ